MAPRTPLRPPPMPAAVEVAPNGNARDRRAEGDRSDPRETQWDRIERVLLETWERQGLQARDMYRTRLDLDLLSSAVHAQNGELAAMRRSLDALTLHAGGTPPPEPVIVPPPPRDRSVSEAELDDYLDKREDIRAGKAFRGTKERVANKVIEWAVLGILALFATGVGYVLSESRHTPTITSPARTTP